MEDQAMLPAAGDFRQRALPPRELLGRTGCHMTAPPLHPAVAQLSASTATYGQREEPAEHLHPTKMHLSRLPPQAAMDISQSREQAAGLPAAGKPSMDTRSKSSGILPKDVEQYLPSECSTPHSQVQSRVSSAGVSARDPVAAPQAMKPASPEC
mmetsp:Transcript_45166/g.98221  ORF Transcript_45166/g.98221 Transcript_45166/m.98221 type:complete len:154 (+) Transcript_45166:94-555(+)